MLHKKTKVDIMLIGGSKCGTTYVYDVLKNSKSIAKSSLGKETNRFLYSHIRQDYDGSCFMAKTVDASPKYSEPIFVNEAANNAYLNNPDMKIILLARNPIKRIPSMFKQCLFSGHHMKPELYGAYSRHPMPFDFSKALREYPILVESNKYASILSSYLRFFPKDQIYIELFENLQKDESCFVDRLGKFLGINDLAPLQKLVNSSSEKLYPSKSSQFLYRQEFRILRRFYSKFLKQYSPTLLQSKEPKIFVSPRDREYIISSLSEEVETFFEMSGLRCIDLWSDYCSGTSKNYITTVPS